jgi:Mg2+-importing ATPase
MLSPLAVMTLAIALPYLLFTALFGFVAVPLPFLVTPLAVTVAYIFVSETTKRMLAKRLW